MDGDMKTTIDRDVEETEYTKVINFRETWLRHAGYNKANASKIAREASIDWHFACELYERCTNEALCMKILF
jgi:hypothetical protein